MGAKSTRSARNGKREKPPKPRPDFPLTPHANGQWCKKIAGTVHFFGIWDDPAAALETYMEDRDAIQAGQPRPSRTAGVLTVEELTERYLAWQESRFEAGEIARTTLTDCTRACNRLRDKFGKRRKIETLTPDDFGKLRATMGEKLSALSLGIEIQRIKAVFRFAWDDNLIDNPMRYGKQFEKPPRKQIRKERDAARGERMFSQSELATLLDLAKPPLDAMILLALNCGFGNRDCALLPRDAVDLRRGWIKFPRPKTGQPRRCPLWPETVDALRVAAAGRPDPIDDAAAELWFLTPQGRCCVRNSDAGKSSWIDEIGGAFQALMEAASTGRRSFIVRGRSFYGLRRTFRTIADGAKDQPAADLIMGHAPDASDMAARYRLDVSDERLRAVVDHVRVWLFPAGGKAKARRSISRRRTMSNKPSVKQRG